MTRVQNFLVKLFRSFNEFTIVTLMQARLINEKLDQLNVQQY